MTNLLTYLPDLIIVGDIEYLFLGAAGALGMPKMARRILNKRYGTSESGDSDTEPSNEQ